MTNEPMQAPLAPGGGSAAELAGLAGCLCSSVSSVPWISLLFHGATSLLIPACHSTTFTAQAVPSCTNPQLYRLLSVLTHLSTALSLPSSPIQFIKFRFACKDASIATDLNGNRCYKSNILTDGV